MTEYTPEERQRAYAVQHEYNKNNPNWVLCFDCGVAGGKKEHCLECLKLTTFARMPHYTPSPGKEFWDSWHKEHCQDLDEAYEKAFAYHKLKKNEQTAG